MTSAVFLLRHSPQGPKTSSEKGQCSKFGRNFETKLIWNPVPYKILGKLLKFNWIINELLCSSPDLFVNRPILCVCEYSFCAKVKMTNKKRTEFL